MLNKKLLVEGKNDQIALSTLCRFHKIWVYNKEKVAKLPADQTFAFECRNKETVDKLLELRQLRNELRESGIESVGVIVDADTNMSGRWQALRDHARTLGYNDVPDEPDRNGTILVSDELPRLGVWIMPNNEISGMLEAFIGLLVPADDALWAHAKNSVAIAASIEPANKRFIPNHLAKAEIHTWLDWQDPPGMPFGTAMTNNCFDVEAPESNIFIAWIRRLFEIEI